MVLGVGISSTYQVWKLGRPYELNISPSILTSTLGLIIVLLSTLIVVYTNGYRVTSQLGIWMISIYCLCILINFLLEFILLWKISMVVTLFWYIISLSYSFYRLFFLKASIDWRHYINFYFDPFWIYPWIQHALQMLWKRVVVTINVYMTQSWILKA